MRKLLNLLSWALALSLYSLPIIVCAEDYFKKFAGKIPVKVHYLNQLRLSQ